MKEIVEMKQRTLAEENQKTLEVLKERYCHHHHDHHSSYYYSDYSGDTKGTMVLISILW